MKAVVWHGVGDIRLDEVPDPRIEEPTDAIVRLTTSAICGTDLHMVRGTMPGMKEGTILGHEGVGIVDQIGASIRNFMPGDRVVIPSTIACGFCSYCRAGYYSQCDNANPNGPDAGTCFFGGPELSGPINGLQAEKARIPFAGVGLVKVPDEVTDEQALLLSDILPTGYMAAELAEIKPGNTVVVFGCGPVGQCAIAAAKLMQAGRIFAVDSVPFRLDLAQEQGAEAIDFSREDPVAMIHQFTGGIGCDRAIDAVGVDASAPHSGPGSREFREHLQEFQQELAQVAPRTNVQGENWHPGDAPSMTLVWAVQSLAKAGTLSIVGVYPQTVSLFPIGAAMNKNLTLKMGNCDHRRFIPKLMELVQGKALDPAKILTQKAPFSNVIEAYQAFDLRKEGWLKVQLQMQGAIGEER
ncbi:formaldehyde dehydrogenase-related protein, glutathione-dependent [Citrifermentans bemidjiense Bem]|uniref:Formaldehyde dehydrogenase-related protein, glutathione-dependent n=1 Tax=Citrifermentans bemidjiense (strain ATCC BAA-1014 / DSM 16622 / JCM 12645 / Bem) TaxID=404380 RepID=B5EHI3_CITBB|nr:zinc-dependent alcohol dehydrogenase [Citrifermentans bemidjiense]ACH38193.1 formaldehyde dehydrogenase-related protein, glutathione-dependent [Citrifermentans bemidjiense Bem]